MDNIAARLKESLHRHNEQASQSYELSLSIGIISIDANSSSSLEELVARADQVMYGHKRSKKEKQRLENTVAGISRDQINQDSTHSNSAR